MPMVALANDPQNSELATVDDITLIRGGASQLMTLSQQQRLIASGLIVVSDGDPLVPNKQYGSVPPSTIRPSGDVDGVRDPNAINYALARYDQVWLSGEYYLAEPLEIPSDTTLILAGAKITLRDEANVNILRNVDYTGADGGNKNIRILGLGDALLDGNVTTMTDPDNGTWEHIGILLSHVDNYEIGGIQIQKIQNWGISPQHSNEGVVHNIYGDQTEGRYQAIIQAGCCKRLVIDGVRGISEDDSVAIGNHDADAAAVTMYADGVAAGDSEDCVIRNVETSHESANGSNVVRLYTGGGSRLKRINVDNCRAVGGVTDTDTNNIAIGVDGFVESPPAVGDIEDIKITNCDLAVFILQTCRAVQIKNLHYNPAYGYGNAILVGGSAEGHQVDDLEIDGLYYDGTATNWALINFFGGGGLVVNRPTIRGIKTNDTFVGPLIYEDGEVTINDLRFLDERGTNHEQVSFFAPPRESVGNWQRGQDATAITGVVGYNLNHVFDDYAIWPIKLSHGTWDMTVAGMRGSDGAQVAIDYSEDGGTTWKGVGWTEQYEDRPVPGPYSQVFPGLPVEHGELLVRFRAGSKDAASSAHQVRLSAMDWTKT